MSEPNPYKEAYGDLKGAFKLSQEAAREAIAIARELKAENEQLRKERDALLAERNKVASGKVSCADCNAILARW